MIETNPPPLFLNESPALWLQVRQAAEAGDMLAVQVALEAMDLPRRLGRLMIAAVGEDGELAAIEKAGGGQAERFARLGEELALLGVNVPTKLEKLREQNERMAQLRADRIAAQRADSAGKIAARQKLWLENWLPELFGNSPGVRGGLLSGLQPAPKTFDAMVAAGLAGTEYQVGDRGWRKLNQVGNDRTQPRRRYQSFSPLAPRR
jgi:hypothetical protein